MIEKFEDLDLDNCDDVGSVESKINEKLNISVHEMKAALSASVVENADELSGDIFNIAPMGDFSKLIENSTGIASFLKEEAHKVEHWELSGVHLADEKRKLLTFKFHNKAIDDADVFQGFVYVSFEGKIKHAFAQGE